MVERVLPTHAWAMLSSGHAPHHLQPSWPSSASPQTKLLSPRRVGGMLPPLSRILHPPLFTSSLPPPALGLSVRFVSWPKSRMPLPPAYVLILRIWDSDKASLLGLCYIVQHSSPEDGKTCALKGGALLWLGQKKSQEWRHGEDRTDHGCSEDGGAA